MVVFSHFAIFFQPWGLWQLFRVSANELPDRTYSGSELLGKEIDELWLRLAECASFEARVATVERYLLERAARASGRTPIMKAAVHLFQQRGICRIDELARHSGLSVRYFERRFSSALGMTQKRFARVTRFQMALDANLHSPRRS
jgi:transcriptional regulator GlxA family with amidase domain